MANPNIYQQFLRPVRSVADYSNELDRGEANALNLAAGRREGAMQEQAMAQQVSERNALQRLAQGWTAQTKPEDRIASLRNSGHAGLSAMADAQEKQQLDRRKVESEATGKDVETENKVIGVYRDMIGMAQNPQAAAELVRVMHSDPRLKNTPMAGASVEQGIGMMGGDPQSFERWKQQFALGAAKYVEQNKPTLTTQNLGGTSRSVSTAGLGGPSSVASEAPITQSADNRATVGASMANANATRAAAQITADASRDTAKTRRDQDTEMKLLDDYRGQSKSFGESKSAFEQLNSTLDSATTSPAATLAAATKFMKILDPGSVVRESELGMALAASGVIDRALNYVSTLQSGKKLTATQAADFKKISGQMYGAAQRVQQDIDADYKSKANTYGLRPEMVTQDLGQNAKAPQAASGVAFDDAAKQSRYEAWKAKQK